METDILLNIHNTSLGLYPHYYIYSLVLGMLIVSVMLTNSCESNGRVLENCIVYGSKDTLLYAAALPDNLVKNQK